MNENKWNVSNLVWEQYGGNGIESFYDNITVRTRFVADRNSVGFAREKALTISFVERGFES